MTERLTGWETTRLSKHFILLDFLADRDVYRSGEPLAFDDIWNDDKRDVRWCSAPCHVYGRKGAKGTDRRLSKEKGLAAVLPKTCCRSCGIVGERRESVGKPVGNASAWSTGCPHGP